MLILVSYGLLILSFLFTRISRHTYPRVIILFTLLFCSAINNALYIGINYFSGNGIDRAVIYHLWFGFEGAGFGDYISLYIMFGTYVLTIIGILYVLHRTMRNKSNTTSAYTYAGIVSVSFSIIFSPTIQDIYTLYTEQQPPAAVHTQVTTDPNAPPQPELDYTFAAHYSTSTPTQTTNTPKNLVLIYLEGLEQTYSNKEVFPGLTPNLDRLSQRSINFTNIIQIEDVGYTIAGMVASQCGIPLVTATNGNTLNGFDSFLPGATCLGDVLKPYGYHLTYYGGSPLSFAGKGLFYKTHKYDDVQGKEELLPLADPIDAVPWGIGDGSLFPILTKTFDRLSSSTTPFVLSNITLETHHPAGMQSQRCATSLYANGKNTMLNSVHCSDNMIGEYVDHILSSPYAKDTIIVIVSDHLGLPNQATKLLNSVPRRDRFMIIDPTTTTPQYYDMLGSTLDIASTVLPFIGFKGNIGLGHDLLSPSTTPSDISFIHTNTKRWYKDIQAFWQLPTVQKHITIDINAETVSIDNRHFLLPALISLTPELKTSLFFRFSLITEKDKLLSYAKKEAYGNFFYMIEQCQILKQYIKNPALTDPLPNTSQLCLASGTNDVQDIRLLTENKTLTKKEILENMQ
jgi:phosphoglycerol transferase